MYARLKRTKAFKYIITGGAAFSCEYVAFIFLFYLIHIPVTIAHPISFMCGFAASFLLNRSWVFKVDKGHPLAVQITLYALLTLVNIVASTFIISALTDGGLQAYIAKLIVTAMVGAWNFFAYKFLIFRQTD